MKEGQNYYDFLGLPRSASVDEIKRVINRMRRNCQDDVEKYSLLEEIQNTLCDSYRREQYDKNLKFGNQIENIQNKIKSIEAKIKNTSDANEQRQYFLEEEKLYLDILKLDSENVDALWNLADIREVLGDTGKAVWYFRKLENHVSGEVKLKLCHRLGEILKQQGETEEAIHYFEIIYREDVTYTDDVKTLVRLYYEEKKELESAIQILTDCINRSESDTLKITYICETLRAIRILKNASYGTLEKVLYRKLESFRSNDKEKNLKNAAAILTAISDMDWENDIAGFHSLEKIYLSYEVDHETLNNTFKAVQQVITAKETGKIHEAIDLYMEDEWTQEIREKISRYIANEAREIKESLEYLKKHTPLFWEMEEDLARLEKVVDENLTLSNELRGIRRDATISIHMEKILSLLAMNTFMGAEELKDELDKASAGFFDEEDKSIIRRTLEKMEDFYPESYKLVSELYLEGKSTQQIFPQTSNIGFIPPRNTENKTADTTTDKTAVKSPDDSVRIGPIIWYIIGVLSYFEEPWMAVIIIAATYLYTHSENRGKWTKGIASAIKENLGKCWKYAKKLLIIAIGIWIVLAVLEHGKGFKEKIDSKIYEKTHDGWLNSIELKKVKKLEKEYDSLTDVKIRYVQVSDKEEIEKYKREDEGIYLFAYQEYHDASYSLQSDYVTGGELENFSYGIWEVTDSAAKDYDAVEGYFELAYQFVMETAGNTKEVIAENSQEGEADYSESEGSESVDSEADDAAYWEMDLETLFQAMKTNAGAEDVKGIIGADAVCEERQYNKSGEVDFQAKKGDIQGILTYSEYYSEYGRNIFTWKIQGSISENWAQDVLGTKPGMAIDTLEIDPQIAVNTNQSVCVWEDKIQIIASYEPDNCYMIFQLISDDDNSAAEGGYLSLSIDEQRAYIASKEEYYYPGVSASDYIDYGVQFLEGQQVHLYQHDDGSGASESLTVLYDDGTIKYYSPDGTLTGE